MGKTEEYQVTDSGTALIVRDSDKFKKSNELIGAKYKSTLLENKLLALSLSKVNQMRTETVTINGSDVKVFTSEIKSNEIKKHLSISSKNLPTQVRAAYTAMATRQIGIENEAGEFKYRSLIIGGDYVNGTLKLYYNPLLSSYYKEVSKNFTLLSLNTLTKFKSTHSYRLYELIVRECYTNKATKKVEADKIIYEIPFEVAELKLSLGVVNSQESAVQKILSRPGHPDYEEAVAKAKEKGFEKWADFRRRCIDPSVGEINMLGEFNLSYEVEKSGQGGKVQGITFFAEYQNTGVVDKQPKTSLSEGDKADFYDAVIDLIDEKLKMRDIIEISEAAEYNIDIIREKYEIAKSQKKIDNLVGWLKKAIKEDYQPPVSKKGKTKNDFNNFKGRDYDYDALMKDALNEAM